MAGRGKGGVTELGPPPDASRGMSAHLHTEAAPAPPVAHAGSSRSRTGGDAAFDRWLRQELTRLYDSALSEPVPEEMLRLLRESGRK